MINYSDPLLWAIVGAILSAILSSGVPILVSWIKYKARPELLGNWKSAYQGIDESHDTWVTDYIFIDTHYGNLRFKNSNSSNDYDYTAKAKLIRGNHLIGDWISKRPGANAKGGFMLTISGQGDSMYGYWVGSDKVGARRYGRWVLARTEDGIADATRHIEEMSKSRIP
ncbi:MAG: hypothetical protein V3U87_15385 [Methylococcaceae bacterium]